MERIVVTRAPFQQDLGKGVAGKGVAGKGAAGKDVAGKGVAGKATAGAGASAGGSIDEVSPSVPTNRFYHYIYRPPLVDGS